MGYEEEQDKLLIEEHGSIIDCLGPKQQRIFSIEVTANGFKIVECCDEYFGITLNKAQLMRLADELKQLAGQ